MLIHSLQGEVTDLQERSYI